MHLETETNKRYIKTNMSCIKVTNFPYKWLLISSAIKEKLSRGQNNAQQINYYNAQISTDKLF